MSLCRQAALFGGGGALRVLRLTDCGLAAPAVHALAAASAGNGGGWRKPRPSWRLEELWCVRSAERKPPPPDPTLPSAPLCPDPPRSTPKHLGVAPLGVAPPLAVPTDSHADPSGLRRRRLDGNLLGDGGAAGIGTLLGRLKGVTTLSLAGCLIGPAGAAALAGGLAGHPSLSTLDLSKNRVELAGATAVMAAAGPPLSRLSFFANRLGDTGHPAAAAAAADTSGMEATAAPPLKAVDLVGEVLAAQRGGGPAGGVGLASLDLGGCSLTAATLLPLCALLMKEAEDFKLSAYKLDTLELLGNDHAGEPEAVLKALRQEFETAREAAEDDDAAMAELLADGGRIVDLDVVWTTSKDR